MVDYGLKDKVVIITGANNPQGIGATTALAFARNKAKIVLVYKKIAYNYDENKTLKNGFDRYYKLNSGSAQIVETKLSELNAQYITLEKDISEKIQVGEIFNSAIKQFGKIDILVNNAAVDDETGKDTIENITSEIIDSIFSVNVRGSMLMMREFIKNNKSNGRIINLSTDSSQVFEGQIDYGSSKATIEALTRSIAIEVGKYGITVNCVSPGPTQTGWIDDELEQKVVKQIPIGKLVQPEDIANTILFLASEQARMITGQVIKVSGGHAL